MHVLPYVYQSLQWVRSTILQIKTKIFSKIFIILHKRPYIPPLFSRKISPLHRRVSRKHSLFTTFSLVLRMGQVFNITNKYQFSNQSAKNLYFHPRDFTYFLYMSQYTRIQDPIEHLKWIFLRKQLTATQENNYYFPRKLHLRCLNRF